MPAQEFDANHQLSRDFAAAADALGRLARVPMDSGELLFIDDTPADVAAVQALG
jgi:hypothetical protein